MKTKEIVRNINKIKEHLELIKTCNHIEVNAYKHISRQLDTLIEKIEHSERQRITIELHNGN